MAFELAAVAGFVEFKRLNHGPHRAVEDDNAGPKELFERISVVFECVHAS